MIHEAIERLIDYGIKKNIFTIEDIHFVRNRLMDLLGLSDRWEREASSGDMSIDEILAPILDYAVEKEIIVNTTASRDLFDTRIMGLLMPMPREVISEFEACYAEGPEVATDWYYRFSRDVNYVRQGRIDKDLKWKYNCEYGEFDITINLSKPEKDPRDIAAARLRAPSGYPKCQLCVENTGYAGHLNHPARQNLIPVPITLGGEEWSLQYSPYGYYNEHCIALNNIHTPMQIDADVFKKLFDFLDTFPHYFIGSNADLPLVGGSILSHEHFQGGRNAFAMDTAPIEESFTVKGYPGVKAGILRWPMSVIRVSSPDRDELVSCCDYILSCWRKYSDPSAFIFAETDGQPHNTITPVSRKSGDSYVCDLVLRNNITTEDRPLGVYHPAPELHHIKKENIGIIEVMGLAILPSRLMNDIQLLKTAILNGENIYENSAISSHADWAAELVREHPELCEENAEDIIRAGIGEVFLKVLLDAGVFKRTPEGKAAFLRFVDKITK